jgi:hypothetical protein
MGLNQKQRILNRLKQGKATSKDLNDICYRYSARLGELRKEGHQIRTTRVKQGLYEYQLITKAVSLVEKQEKRIEEEKKSELPKLFNL